MMYSEVRKNLRNGTMLIATGPCEIDKCASGSTKFVYDHCHKHDHVRGVLCTSCNSVMKRIDSVMSENMRLNVETIRKLTLRLHVPTLPSSYLRHWDKCPECTYSFTSDDVLRVLDFHRRGIMQTWGIYYRGSLIQILRERRRYKRMRHRRRSVSPD